MSANSADRSKYLEEHHHICESAIGLARVALRHDDPDAAAKHLDEAVTKINKALLRYQPETAKFIGLTVE